MRTRVLIVEDDMNYRFAIRSIVDWEKHGFEIAGEAMHGLQALDILRDTKVDIVLTDMSMPMMDGVSLIREIQKKYQNIVIIALSAYDDFQFVKESLKLGACDYILKQDMTEETLLKVMKEAETVISEREKEGRARIEQAVRVAIESSDSMGKNCELPNDVKESLSAPGYYGVLLVNAHMQPGWEKDEKAVLCAVHTGNKLFLLCAASGDRSGNNVSAAGRLLVQSLYQRAGRKGVWGVSELTYRPEGLKRLYTQASCACDYACYARETGIFYYEECPESLRKRCPDFKGERLDGVEMADFSSLVRFVKRQTALMRKNMPPVEQVDKIYCAVYMEVALKHTKQYNRDMMEQFQMRIKAEQFLDEKEGCLLRELEEFWEKQVVRTMGKSAEVKRAMEYIEVHYPDELTLSAVAAEAGLSENYFSNLFKGETGENLMHYINRVRIEKAQYLMENTNLKVYEVAEKVGFKNPAYFSTTFKKITKLSVMEYKKSM